MVSFRLLPAIGFGMMILVNMAAAFSPQPSFHDTTIHVPDDMHDLQEAHAAQVVASFSSRDFSPPAWLSNCHLQTIGAFFVRDLPYCAYLQRPRRTNNPLTWPSWEILPLSNFAERSPHHLTPNYWDERERVETPDGDWFHVDYKYCSPDDEDEETNEQIPRIGIPSRGMVLLLHGLESNSDSSLSRDMAEAYRNVGLDVACLNFRGCTGIPNDTLGGYHLGFTDDVKHFLNILQARYTATTHNSTATTMPPLYLSGFSLGANVVLKALGELSSRAIQDYNIQGATALCVPFDAERNAPCLAMEGVNKRVYSENLLKTLRKRCQDQLHAYCEGNEDTTRFDYRAAMQATTITEFDNAFVAPIYGFESAMDYYRKTSCIHFLEDIRVPTLVLNAKDDPFMDPTVFPTELTCEGGGKAPVKLVRTENGGHLGHIFHQLDDHTNSDNDGPPPLPTTSWAPTELARFLEHVHNFPQYKEST